MTNPGGKMNLISRTFGIGVLLAGMVLVPFASSAQVASAVEPFTLPDIPDPASGPSVTLAGAVRQADSTNRSLLVLKEDMAIASAKLQASWAGLLPSLYGSFAYSLSENAVALDDGTSEVNGPGDTSRLTAGLSLKVPLIEARQWMLIESARSESEVTELQIEQARQVLLYSVAEAYYQAATALTLITVYRSQFDALMEHLRLAEARMDAGVGNVMDVRSAQTDLVSSWVGIVKAGYALADAREALGILMGVKGQLPMPAINADVAGTPSSGLSADLLAAMGADGDAAPVDADASIDSRWDLKVQKIQIDAMKADLKSGKMAFVPSLGLSFNYGADILAAAAATSTDPDYWTLGLNLSIPLFDFTLFPGLTQQKARIRQAELQVEQLEIEGAAAIASADRNVRMLSHMMAAQKVKTVLADDLLDLAEADYANGTGLAIAVTDARRTALAAHLDLATATWEYELGQLHMNREMGVDIMKALEGR